MDGKSLNITEERVQRLRELFPEVFSESKVDFQRLQQLLGEENLVHGEHYELNWAGKAEARKEVQRQTTATLVPDRDNSIDFDKAPHVFIEGENLEVLRVLQKSYFGKVKMIYIDPPYNTGNDSFVYPDDYSERKEAYEKRSGAKDAEGFLNKHELWKKNTKENGQFHSVWLSMMYPRLYLSRNLLREDGALFISIDENEYANLKLLCDEIFGNENFRNSFVIRRYDKNLNRQFIENGLKTFNVGFEYILCYAKSANFSFNPILREGSEERMTTGYWKGFWNDADRSTMRYEIEGYKPETGQWKWSKAKAEAAIQNYITFREEFESEMSLEAYWAATGRKLSFIRRNLNGQGKNKGVEHWIAPSEGALRNTNWTDLFASKSEKLIEGFFDFPKNVEVIKNLIIGSCDEDDLILDFFAGSGTTAQAVLELNEADGGNRKFMCVQMAEPLAEDTDAYEAGFRSIADISRLRIKSVIQKLEVARSGKQQQAQAQVLAFAAFSIAESNFNNWRTDVQGKAGILEQLSLFRQSEKAGSDPESMFTELLLKAGLGLKVPFKKEGPFYKTEKVWFCFEVFDSQLKEQILAEKPAKVIFLNSCFKRDKDLTNLQLELKEQHIKLTLV